MKNPPELRYDPHLTLVLFPAGGTRQDGSHTVFFFDSWDVPRHVRCQGWLQRDLWRGWSTCLTFRDFRISKFSFFFPSKGLLKEEDIWHQYLTSSLFFANFCQKPTDFCLCRKYCQMRLDASLDICFHSRIRFFFQSQTGQVTSQHDLGPPEGITLVLTWEHLWWEKLVWQFGMAWGGWVFMILLPKTTTGFSKSLDWFEIFTWVVSTGNLPQVVIDSPWKRAQARPFGTLMVCDGFCHSVSMWLYMHKNMYAHIPTYTNSLHLLLCILVSLCMHLYNVFNFQTSMCIGHAACWCIWAYKPYLQARWMRAKKRCCGNILAWPSFNRFLDSNDWMRMEDSW